MKWKLSINLIFLSVPSLFAQLQVNFPSTTAAASKASKQAKRQVKSIRAMNV